MNLLAVSKGHPASAIRLLTCNGQRDFGESRIQEALPKMDLLKDLSQIRWHFIGHLQANKVRKVIKSFTFIHSVDSFSLSERISRIAQEENCLPKVMLQIKLREDPSKGGFSMENLQRFWPQLIRLSHINIIGLMTIPPIHLDLQERKKVFVECREFANKLELTDCSMGMSNDWEEALECGATWIRVGSFLFGQRKP